MKRSATASRAHARLEFAAVVRCALDVCDELHRRGLEDDDRPRLWLDAALRWGLGEKDAGGLAGRTTALKWWMSPSAKCPLLPDPAQTWRIALDDLRDARVDIANHVTHAGRQLARAKIRLEAMWRRLADEPIDAAEHRVRESFVRHLAALKQERVGARFNAGREKALADRAEAERLLALPLRTGAVP